MEDYPEELRDFPVPLVALIGQTQLHNSLKKNISTRKDIQGKDTCSFNFLSLDAGATFMDRRKDRRTSYESYSPGGILKANWLYRQKNLIPSVAVLLLNWEVEPNSNWKSKETEYFTEYDSLKKNLKVRSTKIMVAFIMKQSIDLSYDERVAAFKKRAELDSKYMFCISTDNGPDTGKRLEKMLNEVTRNYYKEEARRIKKDYNKSNVSKQTLSILSVRHNFKIAIFAEFRRNNRGALKYYNLAYNSLKEITASELKSSEKSKIYEIKMVSDFVSFQITKLYLFMGNVNEAVTHFQKHIKAYKTVIGVPDLEFEHWAWVSRQYTVFGQLLDLLANSFVQNVPKQSYQHPGFYYQAGARFAGDRKKATKRLCEPHRNNPAIQALLADSSVEAYNPNVTANFITQNISYIGERPMITNTHPLGTEESTTSNGDQDVINRIYAGELKVDHSNIIIELLTKAYEQYKGPKSSRMILYIAAQMAQEYVEAQKYVIAKKFFDRIGKSYRKEEWRSLLCSILTTSSKCALKLGLVKDYIEYSLDLLVDNPNTPFEEKQGIQKSLLDILENPASLSVPPLENSVVIPMQYNHPLIGVKIQFTKSSVYAKSELPLRVQITSNFPSPIRFSKLNLQFGDSSLTKEIVDSNEISELREDSSENSLLFFPDKPRIFSFKFISQGKMDLKCSQVLLELGIQEKNLKLSWNVNEWPEFDKSQQIIEGKKAFLERTSARILAHEAKVELSLTHEAPALVGEFYKIDLKLKNKGEQITQGVLTLDLNPPADECAIFGADRSSRINQIELKTLETNEEWATCFYFYSPIVIRKKLMAKVAFDTSANYSSSLEKSFDISVQVPFTSSFNFFTQQFHPITPTSGSIVVNQPFYFCIDVQCTTPFPIKITSSNIVLNSRENEASIANMDGSTNVSGDRSYVLVKENKFTIWYQILPNTSGETVDLGFIQLDWRRLSPHDKTQGDSKDLLTTGTKIDIPPVKINTAPFTVKIEVPSFAVVGSVTPLTMRVYNHTDFLQEFSLVVNESASFLYAGDKETIFCIHPQSSHNIKHNLIPLMAGRQPLPHLQVTSKRLNEELPQTKQRYIFVNPPKGETRFAK